MPATESRGPSPWWEWTFSKICALTPPETLCIRLLPDDAQEKWYGLLEVPRLLRVNQQPKFSLTLLLERAPQPNEDRIRHLVVSGYLGMEISYELPAEAAKQVSAVPLYARRALMKVEGSSGVTLAEVELATPLLRGTLHLYLKKDDVLSVLDALDRDISTIRLKTTVEFRAAAPGDSISIRLRCAELWDQFHAECREGDVTEETARRVFDRLIESGGIIMPEGAGDRAFRLFLFGCQQFLHKHDGEYTLAKRPALSSQTFQERWDSSIIRSFELDCRLDQVIGGALQGLGREAFVHIVGPSGTFNARGPALTSLKRVRSRGVREFLRAGLVAMGSNVETIAATLQPATTSYQTAHLLATETLKPTAVSTSGIASTYMSNNAVYLDGALLAIKRPRMPVVIDANAALFRDEVSSVHRWYLPSVRLVSPAPNVAPETSPFLFEYERIGSTSSGLPAIRGRVRFTLELGMPENTAAELRKLSGVEVSQIEPVEPSVTLTVPYIDEADGRLKRALYRGQCKRSGTRLQASVELLNDAVRTTYGSLSTAGFQPEKARIEISYQFKCLAPVTDRPQMLIGGKIAMATFLTSARGDGASRIEVGSGSREMVFRVEARRPAVNQGEMTIAATHAGANTTAMIARPPMVLSATAVTLPHKLQYAQRAMIRQEKIEAFFACETLGEFYRENSSTGSTAIGCAEAFRLGQASTKCFQEIAEMATGEYRVFRNLQQPARFLLLPAFYRITRYASEVGEKAYRPIILAYAALDAENEENSRILYEAMLAPDITPLAYRELRRRLLAEAQNPFLELPNTLAEDVSYHWDLSSSLSVEVTVVRTPDCFDASLATDLMGALLLKNVIQNTGISGEARFKLYDGTLLASTLSIDLNRITGPWPEGGVAVQRNGRVVTLANKVERDVTVRELHAYTGQQAPVRIPVERTIGRGASIEVTGPESFDEVVPDANFLSGGTVSLEEIRAMIEDIRTNVIFVDLVNYENHELSEIQIDARLKGLAGTSRVRMENRRGSVDFLLPITTYLTTMILEYRVTKIFAAKPSETTQWLEWNIETSSNVVSITWDRIG